MSNEIRKILDETSTVMEGHFLLTSGRHSPLYVEKFRLLQYPKHTEKLCAVVVNHFRSAGAQVVAGPTLGGVLLAYEVARQLGIRSIYAEREGEARVFRRGLNLAPGERVLVVDDILTTGGSVREVVDAVRAQGASPVGIGILVDRTVSPVTFDIPFFSCYQMTIPSYQPDACPQCKQGLPLAKPGGSPS